MGLHTGDADLSATGLHPHDETCLFNADACALSITRVRRRVCHRASLLNTVSSGLEEHACASRTEVPLLVPWTSTASAPRRRRRRPRRARLTTSTSVRAQQPTLPRNSRPCHSAAPGAWVHEVARLAERPRHARARGQSGAHLTGAPERGTSRLRTSPRPQLLSLCTRLRLTPGTWDSTLALSPACAPRVRRPGHVFPLRQNPPRTANAPRRAPVAQVPRLRLRRLPRSAVTTSASPRLRVRRVVGPSLVMTALASAGTGIARTRPATRCV